MNYKRRRKSINRGMDMLEEGLKEIPPKNIKDKSPEKIAKIIERMLKEDIND